MSDWTSGYVSEINYTHGHYLELNPLYVDLAFLNKGLVMPEKETACELGFGQGVSINLHAASSGIHWYGTDFISSQAAFAKELAAISGGKAKLCDQSFEVFCSREDLPEFDFVGLHGVWSWISSENRSLIVDFLERKLKPGGVVYMGYNTQPGWSSMVPIRDLMSEHTKTMDAPAVSITERLVNAVKFTQSLITEDSKFAKANPGVLDRLKSLESGDPKYSVHEYLNFDWEPMSFAKVSGWMSQAKLEYACSATYLDHVDALNFTPKQQELLYSITDTVVREMAADLIINRQFRRDYWIKGKRNISPSARIEKLRSFPIILTVPRASVSLDASGALGKAKLQENVYNPVLDVLACCRPMSLGEIEKAVAQSGVNLSQIVEAALVLVGKGVIHPVQTIEFANTWAERLNKHLCLLARDTGDVQQLASPVTGGGVSVSRFFQLFMLAQKEGLKTSAELANYSWKILSERGEKIVKEERLLETAEENLLELEAEAADFLENYMPVYSSLGIV